MSKDKSTLNLVDGSVDAGLHMLAALTPRGVVRSQEEIALACGCSVQNIQQIERRARARIKAEIEKRGLEKIIREFIQP